MNLTELIFISFGLAMDCFAVSFSAGATQKNLRFSNAIIIGLFFGFFQGGMPLLGWQLGEVFVNKIGHFDHWIAFIILVFIGGKMILETVRPAKEKKPVNIMHLPTLLILSIATSIDALAVGFSFAMINVDNIRLSVLSIGLFSFLLSVLGIYGGKKLSTKIKSSYAEIAGGIILIIIGSKILIEHLVKGC